MSVFLVFDVCIAIVTWSIIQTMTTTDGCVSPANSLAPKCGAINAVKISSPGLAGWR